MISRDDLSAAVQQVRKCPNCGGDGAHLVAHCCHKSAYDVVHCGCFYERESHEVAEHVSRCACAPSRGDPLFQSSPSLTRERLACGGRGGDAEHDVSIQPLAHSREAQRLREAVPGLKWETHGAQLRGHSPLEKRRNDPAVCVGTEGLYCWLESAVDAHAIETETRPSDDECVRIVTEWYAKTHATPAAPQPSLRAPEATEATASKRSPRELAAHDLVALFQREFPDASVGFCGDGSRVWVEQWSERVEWEQGPTPGCWWRDSRIATNTQWIIATTRDVLAAAAKRRGYSTVTINGNILNTDALTRALDEQSKAQQAHTKGTTMTTQTKTQALIQTAKLDASEAVWRTAGSQFVKLAREPLVGLLTRHLAPNDEAFRARLAAFLETELGTALLASMLSATLSALPQTTGEVPQKLARELRVSAMATAGDELAGVLMDPLLSVMRLYLQDPQGAPAAPALPEAEQATQYTRLGDYKSELCEVQRAAKSRDDVMAGRLDALERRPPVVTVTLQQPAPAPKLGKAGAK